MLKAERFSRIEFVDKGPRFYSNAIRQGFSVSRISAEAAKDLGLDVSISAEASNNYEQPLPGYVAIYGSHEVKQLLTIVSTSPEGRFLRSCFEVDNLGFLNDEDLASLCEWDKTTVNRVRALYHQRVATLWESLGTRHLAIHTPEAQTQAEQCDAKSAISRSLVVKLLGKESLPDIQEAETLIADLVRREAVKLQLTQE